MFVAKVSVGPGVVCTLHVTYRLSKVPGTVTTAEASVRKVKELILLTVLIAQENGAEVLLISCRVYRRNGGFYTQYHSLE